MKTPQDFRRELERQKGRRDQIVASIKKADEEYIDLHLQEIYCEEAQTIIQNVAQLTQSKLEYHVSELGTLALASVFNDPFKLRVDFVLRRNRTEADIWFVSTNGHKVPPYTLGCGGEIDMASFALRPSIWSLSPQRTASVLFLDEPLKWLKGENLPELGAAVIKEVSSKLGLQMIMVSHIPEQVEHADRKIHFHLEEEIIDGVMYMVSTVSLRNS